MIIDDLPCGGKAKDISSPDDVIDLWPEGPARSIEGMPEESTFRLPDGVARGTTTYRNVSKPTLSVFRPNPSHANGESVLIFPGGGWKILFWENEGIDVARWFVARGYTAFLLKYRLAATAEDPADFEAMLAKLHTMVARPVPAASAPTAFDDLMFDAEREAREVSAEDARRALQIVRERAVGLGLKPEKIGLIGFSAGAAIAVDVAMSPQGPPPAFIGAIYGGDTGGRPIPIDAPPLFTIVALDDRFHFRVVERLYREWSGADLSAELHVFARGGHSFGMIQQGRPSDSWIGLFEGWLADQRLAHLTPAANPSSATQL